MALGQNDEWEMKSEKWFRQLFYIRKSDRTTLVALLLIAAGILVLIRVTGGQTDETASGLQDTIAVSPRDSFRHHHPIHQEYFAQPQKQTELFTFDPNTADSIQLLRLGLRPWQIRNIYKYRAKGGIYRKPSDFARLYGLTVGEYRRLEPYIRIGRDYQPAASLPEASPTTEPRRDSLKYPVKLKPTETLGLNTSDTAQLRRVPGIGPYYAAEIVRYGKWLGGYANVDQLDEIEGFPKESKRYFVIDGSVRKLPINKLTLQQLRRHPYINYHQAKAIVDYRRLRGPIHSLSDLSLSPDFSPETIRRLEPYIEY